MAKVVIDESGPDGGRYYGVLLTERELKFIFELVGECDGETMNKHFPNLWEELGEALEEMHAYWFEFDSEEPIAFTEIGE